MSLSLRAREGVCVCVCVCLVCLADARRVHDTGDDLNDGDGGDVGYAHGDDDFSDEEMMRSPVRLVPFALALPALRLCWLMSSLVVLHCARHSRSDMTIWSQRRCPPAAALQRRP